ncbi:MAG: URC4/urg3 family protein [Xanthobacteraceae bacterium]|nr:URC4/urg3 family protein [Xanthobacteraceae bacterium]
MTEHEAALSLLSAAAVRERANLMLQKGLDDALAHFRIDLGRLEAAADLTLEVTRAAYPDLDIPFHSRWRHFVSDGADRWAAVAAGGWRDAATRARASFDLAIVSVLLDAGAGPRWQFRDPVSGRTAGRSEGLALASLAMFTSGAFSARPGDPLRADARGLASLTHEALAAGFQASETNPLAGLAGRAELLRRLGHTVAAAPQVFGTADEPRPGGLFDHLAGLAEHRRIEAATILRELLIHLGPIWPSRETLGDIALGDCWRHPAIRRDDPTDRLVPFHKLSQWLAYSLIEPLEQAGIAVTNIDGLTGLAEYRNGGLLIDTGTLVFRDPADAARKHDVSSPLVVEWRALTVALLDRLAALIRTRLGRDAAILPLGRILQGGTWSAGRALAAKLRPDGSPPVAVISDGTVF